MAVIFEDVGTVRYNGYTFDGATHISIKCEPVFDDAQRTVVYHRYLIRVVAIVADADNTELSLADIRYRLTKAGQVLTVQNKGFYHLMVNQNTPNGFVNDVAFGPKPKLVSWEPIGSTLACEVVWECETCIAYCSTPKYHAGVMAMNYELTYALDYRGLTVRTIAGYFEIAMTRNGYAIPDTADSYRNVIGPAIPSRFQRTTQTYKLSLDKRRVDFTIVDTELPSNNPWPLGTVKIEAKHRVGWTRRNGQAHRLRNTITVDVEMGADQPMLNAYAIFAAIVKKRLDVAKGVYGPSVLLEDVSVEESLFDRTCSFSVQYTILKTLRKILTDTGLWQSLGLTTWGMWAYSLQNLTHTRGYARLQHLAGNDAIIDPCGAVFTIPWDASATPPTQQALETKNLLKNETPNADSSWLDYSSHVYVLRDRAVVRHAILQQPDAEDGNFDPQTTDGLRYPALSGLPDIMQRCGKSRYTATLQGAARRVGHPIPRPSLTQIGTATATEIDGDFITRIEKNLFGVPVYVARWNIRYALETEPDLVEPMYHLAQGVQSDGTTEQPDGV